MLGKDEPQQPRLFFGWHVVGATFLVAVFAWGIGFYGPPIFLETLHRTRGWSTSLISAAITAHFLLGAAFIAILARLHARYGVPAVTRAGGVLTALGLLGWACAQQPWQLFAATPLSGAGWAMTSGAALNAMISPWFARRRPAALSMAFNGASMGGVIFAPLWVALIGRLGFARAAAVVALAVVGALWWIANRYLTRTPESLGLTPDGGDPGRPAPVLVSGVHAPALGRPWSDRRFATLAVMASLGLFAQIGLIAELFLLLVPALGHAGAGAAMAGTTACAMAGRSVLGIAMGPASDRRSIAAANVLLQAAGSAAFILATGHTVPLLLLGCVLFGLGLGNVASLPALIAQSEFAPADVQRVVALVTAISQASFAFAPVAFGLLHGIGPALHLANGPGSAPLLFAAAAAFQLLSAGASLLGRPSRRGVPSVAVWPR